MIHYCEKMLIIPYKCRGWGGGVPNPSPRNNTQKKLDTVDKKASKTRLIQVYIEARVQ
jgi:hypothetical protein